MKGKLIGNGVVQYEHEKMTIDYFLNNGEDVELLLPKKTGGKNADFVMRGLVWEMKSPVSNNCKTLVVTLRRASKQSVNVIIDLRRVKGGDVKMKNEIKKFFNEVKKINNLLVITKGGEVIEYKR